MVRLLPGEGDSTDVDDVEHWVAVYGELAAFVRDLILAIPSPEIDLEEHRTLVDRLRWLNERLEFWSARRAELRRG
jgi:hypothetical protein